MTPKELEQWIEERSEKSGKPHYDELVAVAFNLVKTSDGPQRDRRGRRLDVGQADAERIVQQAMAQALESPTFARLEAKKAWPWLADQVRGHASSSHRAGRRARKAHQAWAGSFRGTTGYRTQPAVAWTKDGETRHLSASQVKTPIVVQEQYQNDDENGHGFVGPHGDWKGEYTVSHLGKCPCGGESWSRIELGRDLERQGYSKRWTTEALMAIEHAVRRAPYGGLERLAGYAVGSIARDAATYTRQHTTQVLGCWNGHRTYTTEINV